MARAMKGRNEVKTLASITGQPEEDVVAMLKQHGGDVNAATNALMDSACPVSRAPSTLRFPVLSQRFFGEAVGGREKKNAIAPRPPPRRSTPPDPAPRPLARPDFAVEKFEVVVKGGKKKKEVRGSLDERRRPRRDITAVPRGRSRGRDRSSPPSRRAPLTRPPPPLPSQEAPKPRAREGKSNGREKRAGDKREQKRDGRTGALSRADPGARVLARASDESAPSRRRRKAPPR